MFDKFDLRRKIIDICTYTYKLMYTHVYKYTKHSRQGT